MTPESWPSSAAMPSRRVWSWAISARARSSARWAPSRSWSASARPSATSASDSSRARRRSSAAVGAAAGDLLGHEGAQAGGTGLGLGAPALEALDGTLGLVGRVGDDPGGLGLGLLEGGRWPRPSARPRRCAASWAISSARCWASASSSAIRPLTAAMTPWTRSAYEPYVVAGVRVGGLADRRRPRRRAGEHRLDRGGGPLGLLGGVAQLLLALGAGGGEGLLGGLAHPLGLGAGRTAQVLGVERRLVAHPGGLGGGAGPQRLGLGGRRVEVLLAGGARLLDEPGGGLLRGGDDGLGLGLRGLEQRRLRGGGGVAQLLRLGAQRDARRPAPGRAAGRPRPAPPRPAGRGRPRPSSSAARPARWRRPRSWPPPRTRRRAPARPACGPGRPRRGRASASAIRRRASSRRTARSAVSRSASCRASLCSWSATCWARASRAAVAGSPEEAVAASRAICPLPSHAFRGRHCGSATAPLTKGSAPLRSERTTLSLAAGRPVEWTHEAPRARRHPVPLPRDGRPGGGPRLGRHLRLPRRVRARARTARPTCRGTAPTTLPAAVADGGWDAVVDVTRLPSQVRRAVAATADAHWVFVSTISVYADNSSPATEPLAEPITEDVDLAVDPEAYGGMKVACEQAVQERAASSVIVRPGLIVGPGDPTGRFAYWPQRLARGGEVLAPGRPDDVVQVIDVRDLATWLLDLAESRTTGVVRRGRAAGAVRRPAGRGGRRRRATRARAHVGRPGLPRGARASSPGPARARCRCGCRDPEYDGMLAHDPGPAVAAGLRLRPVGRDRTRLPRLPGHRAHRRAGGRGAGGLARPLTGRLRAAS